MEALQANAELCQPLIGGGAVLTNSQKAWHVFALLLSIGRPALPIELASNCTLFRTTPDFIEFLCSIPCSPLHLTTDCLVTFSSVVYTTFAKFIAFVNVIAAVSPGLMFEGLMSGGAVDNDMRTNFGKKRPRWTVEGLPVLKKRRTLTRCYAEKENNDLMVWPGETLDVFAKEYFQDDNDNYRSMNNDTWRPMCYAPDYKDLGKTFTTSCIFYANDETFRYGFDFESIKCNDEKMPDTIQNRNEADTVNAHVDKADFLYDMNILHFQESVEREDIYYIPQVNPFQLPGIVGSQITNTKVEPYDITTTKVNSKVTSCYLAHQTPVPIAEPHTAILSYQMTLENQQSVEGHKPFSCTVGNRKVVNSIPGNLSIGEKSDEAHHEVHVPIGGGDLLKSLVDKEAKVPMVSHALLVHKPSLEEKQQEKCSPSSKHVHEDALITTEQTAYKPLDNSTQVSCREKNKINRDRKPISSKKKITHNHEKSLDTTKRIENFKETRVSVTVAEPHTAIHSYHMTLENEQSVEGQEPFSCTVGNKKGVNSIPGNLSIGEKSDEAHHKVHVPIGGGGGDLLKSLADKEAEVPIVSHAFLVHKPSLEEKQQEKCSPSSNYVHEDALITTEQTANKPVDTSTQVSCREKDKINRDRKPISAKKKITHNHEKFLDTTKRIENFKETRESVTVAEPHTAIHSYQMALENEQSMEGQEPFSCTVGNRKGVNSIPGNLSIGEKSDEAHHKVHVPIGGGGGDFLKSLADKEAKVPMVSHAFLVHKPSLEEKQQENCSPSSKDVHEDALITTEQTAHKPLDNSTQVSCQEKDKINRDRKPISAKKKITHNQEKILDTTKRIENFKETIESVTVAEPHTAIHSYQMSLENGQSVEGQEAFPCTVGNRKGVNQIPGNLIIGEKADEAHHKVRVPIGGGGVDLLKSLADTEAKVPMVNHAFLVHKPSVEEKQQENCSPSSEYVHEDTLITTEQTANKPLDNSTQVSCREKDKINRGRKPISAKRKLTYDNEKLLDTTKRIENFKETRESVTVAEPDTAIHSYQMTLENEQSVGGQEPPPPCTVANRKGVNHIPGNLSIGEKSDEARLKVHVPFGGGDLLKPLADKEAKVPMVSHALLVHKPSIEEKQQEKCSPSSKYVHEDALINTEQTAYKPLDSTQVSCREKDQLSRDTKPISAKKNLTYNHEKFMDTTQKIENLKETRESVNSYTSKDQIEQKELPNFESYVVEEEEGSGGYGTVYRARRKSDGKKFAIKYPHSNANRQNILNEVKMLERFGGKNFVIRYEGSFKDGNSDCVVLEHVEHDRPDILKREIEVIQLQWYAYCMFKALASLHKQGIVHRDVKPGNFLFTRRQNKGYLIDFNLALDMNQKYGNPDKTNLGPATALEETGHSFTKFLPPNKSRKEAVNQEAALKGVKRTTLQPKNMKRKDELEQTRPDNGSRSMIKSQGADGSGITSAKEATSTRIPSAERLRETLLRQPLPSQGRKQLISLVEEMQGANHHNEIKGPTSKRKRIAAPPGKEDRQQFIYVSPMPLHSSGIAIRGAGLLKGKGDAKQKREGSCVGTKGFRAPEVLFRSPHQGTKLDIWSAGVSLLYLMTGRSPFAGDPDQNIREVAKLKGSEDLWEVAKLHNRECSFPEDLFDVKSLHSVKLEDWCKRNTRRADFFDAIPPSLFDLVDKCLTVNPRLRVSAEEALRHEFFAPCHEAFRKHRLSRQGATTHNSGNMLPSSTQIQGRDVVL